MENTKRILIPNDFSVKSLSLVKEVVEQMPHQSLEIIMLHGMFLPNSISDLLFYSKGRMIREMESEEFLKAHALISSKFKSQIVSMATDFIYFNDKKNMQKYLDSNRIDEVYIPADIRLDASVHRRSFDIIPYLHKCLVPVTALKMKGDTQEEFHFTNQVSDLFYKTTTQPVIQKS